jgi:hypothetical protein
MSIEISCNTANYYNDVGLKNLEAEFASLAFSDVNIQKCDFADYLSLNEGMPEQMGEHLELMEEGVVVFTGGERGFFTVLFSKEEKFQGGIGRDINYKVKCYGDFNTLLLRLCQTRSEYVALSDSAGVKRGTSLVALDDRVEVIQSKIDKSSLPGRVKEYYSKHCHFFASIYYQHKFPYEDYSKAYDVCRYDRNDAQFSKLQNYAREGKIIFTTGDINDLRFLKDKISVIDTSNICDYSFLNFETDSNSCPRVIWTVQKARQASYYSFVHDLHNMSNEEKTEFDEALDVLKQSLPSNQTLFAIWVKHNLQRSFLADGLAFRMKRDFNFEQDCDIFNAGEGPFYTKKNLQLLKKYIKDYIVKMPGIGFVNILSNIEKLNEACMKDINALCENKELPIDFLEVVVSNWYVLNPTIYLAFIRIEGWKEAFENHMFKESPIAFCSFLERLNNNVLGIFVEGFGKERLIEGVEGSSLLNESRKNDILPILRGTGEN